MQKPARHAAPWMQSTSALMHGKTHFPYWVLQCARPHAVSLLQGKAAGPGTDICPALGTSGGGVPGGGGWPP
jgi:hypothetical protein